MRKPSRANSNFAATNTDVSLISDKIHKEFNVLKLIDVVHEGTCLPKQTL
jgi:hypothetical protein